jgi:hypothetical protein
VNHAYPDDPVAMPMARSFPGGGPIARAAEGFDPVPKSPTLGELERTVLAAEGLLELIVHLEQRLRSVLVPPPPATNGGSSEKLREGPSVVEAEIQRIQERIIRCADAISEITSRLRV